MVVLTLFQCSRHHPPAHFKVSIATICVCSRTMTHARHGWKVPRVMISMSGLNLEALISITFSMAINPLPMLGRKNSRVKTLKIYVEGKTLCILHLQDVMQEQTFELPEFNRKRVMTPFPVSKFWMFTKVRNGVIPPFPWFGFVLVA